jgi:hypothetical protein
METNEQMNVEEQNVEQVEQAEAKAEPTEKLYTKAEMDAYTDEVLNDKFAKWQKKQEKKVEEAKKLAEMNAEEKAKYERDEIQKELDALKAEKAHAELAKTVKEMIKKEFDVTPQDGLADVLVKDTAEATNDAVKGFVAFFNEFFKLKVGGNEPRRGSTSALTREQIFAIKDPNKRLKAIEENIELFQKGN